MNKERKSTQKKLWDSLKRNGFNVDVLPYGSIKIDTNTTLEKFFTSLIVIGLVSIVILLFVKYGDFVIIGIFISIIGIICRIYTDNYFIFDLINKNIRYHFSFFSFKKEYVRFKFSDIMTLSVDCKMEKDSNNGKVWYEYEPILITKSRKRIVLSDCRQKDLGNLNYTVELLAEELAVPFVNGEEEKRCVIEKTDINTYDLVFKNYKFYEKWSYITYILLILFIPLLILSLFLILVINRN